MTETSLTETPLAQLQRQLDAARAELQQFTYAVSHDLRAPLRHINAYAQIMVEDWPDMPDEMAAHLGTIRQSAQLLTRQLDGLTQLSRLNLQPLNLQPVDVSALAREVAAELVEPVSVPVHSSASAPSGAPLAAPASASVVWQLASDVPLALTDAALLRQVLVQLLGNALKFSRSCNPAIITLVWQTVPAQAPGQALNQALNQIPSQTLSQSPNQTLAPSPVQGAACQITLSDNGVGFAPEQGQALFQVFGKLHPAREFEGLGLGLVQCRKMLERLGGSITISGAVNAGCRVSFTLPIA